MRSITAHQNAFYSLCFQVVLLVTGLLSLIGIFWAECYAAVSVWFSSTAYGHCFLVVPIVIYLIWDRRESWCGLRPRPTPLLAVLTIPFSFTWLTAERLGIMEGRQLAFILMVEVLFLTVLGWNLFQALIGPLLYLVFLVPFGTFMTPLLQNFTAHFIDIGLTLLAIPHFVTAMVIEISAGTFYVAEACAGLRFLIASVAFGVFFSLLNYHSPGRRSAFIAASIMMPVIANGFRALGIVVLGHVLGSAEAAAADHLIYGWIFFSAVLLLLVVIGLPFRESPVKHASVTNSIFAPTAHPWAALSVIVIAVIGPATAKVLNSRMEPARLNGVPTFAALPGCRFEATHSRSLLPDRYTADMMCHGRTWTVTIQVVSTKSTAVELNEVRNRLLGSLNYDHVSMASLPNTPGWEIIISEEPPQIAVISSWLDGHLIEGGIRQRALQARYSIFGSDHEPLFIAVTTKSTHAFSEIERLALIADASQFVTLQTDLADIVANLSSK